MCPSRTPRNSRPERLSSTATCTQRTPFMTPTTSLLDRAQLDRDAVRREVGRGLSGADDGELFLEYSQTEALMFDNGRLKQATYDTSQGFALGAVKDDAAGYAHSFVLSLPALIR